MFFTTDRDHFVFATDLDYLDADFGLVDIFADPDFTCPKTIGFWKQQFKQKRSAKYSAEELEAIVAVALDLTPVFNSYNEIKTAIFAKGNQGALMRAKRQFAAFALNLAAYELLYDLSFPAGLGANTALDLLDLTDAATAGEAFAEVEGYILAESQLGLANELADAINNGAGLNLICEL